MATHFKYINDNDNYQDNLQAKVKLIESQNFKYGPEFVNALMEEYDFTNNNLLNKGNN